MESTHVFRSGTHDPLFYLTVIPHVSVSLFVYLKDRDCTLGVWYYLAGSGLWVIVNGLVYALLTLLPTSEANRSACVCVTSRSSLAL
jgi:hypothetical protein